MKPLRVLEETRLWVASLLVIGAAFYFLVYSPKTHEGTTLAALVAAQRTDIARLQAEIGQRKGIEGEIADLQNATSGLGTKLPSAREIPRLLLQLDELSSRTGVTVTSLKPGPLQTATVPSAAPAGPARPGGRAPVSGTPKPAKPKPAPYDRFPIEFEIRGSFPAVMQFVRGLEDFPRFLAISDLRVTPATPKRGEDPDDPAMSLAFTVTAYVRPENGDSP
jgi:Tfp pilus assembly protein PilO